MRKYINVSLDLPNIEKYVYDQLIQNEKVRLACSKKLWEFCDPFVPYLSGAMSRVDIDITPDYVEYYARYAVRQYYLHDMDADLAGTTNRTRHPHKLATSYWDKAMMQIKGDEFVAALQKIFDERARELNGGRE